jgi:hypothetical protein
VGSARDCATWGVLGDLGSWFVGLWEGDAIGVAGWTMCPTSAFRRCAYAT